MVAGRTGVKLRDGSDINAGSESQYGSFTMKLAALLAISLITALGTNVAWAQNYPGKPIKINLLGGTNFDTPHTGELIAAGFPLAR